MTEPAASHPEPTDVPADVPTVLHADAPAVRHAGSGQGVGDVASAWAALSRVDDWVRHAETKLAGVLAASLVVGGILSSLAVEGDGAVASALTVAAGLATAGALICAVAGLMPRLAPTGARPRDPDPLFFRDVAQRFPAGDDYARSLVALTGEPHRLTWAIGRQVFAGSAIALGKFRWATRALTSMTVAVVLTGALALVSR